LSIRHSAKLTKRTPSDCFLEILRLKVTTYAGEKATFWKGAKHLKGIRLTNYVKKL